MKRLICLSIVAAGLSLAPVARGQTVYEPIRYQYGSHGEVFYGGQNPNFAQNAQNHMPPALQSSANGPATAPPRNGGPSGDSVGPYAREQNGTSLVYSDAAPYKELSHDGYTPDVARNEAYANIPLVQYGGGRPAPATPVMASTGATKTYASEK